MTDTILKTITGWFAGWLPGQGRQDAAPCDATFSPLEEFN